MAAHISSSNALFCYVCLTVIKVCCEGKCGTPGLPHGGHYRPNKTEFQPGESIEYSCQANRQIFGPGSRNCKMDGSWSGIIPTCGLSMPLINASQTSSLGEYGPEKAVDKNFDTCTCSTRSRGSKWSTNIAKRYQIAAVRITLPANKNISLVVETISGKNRTNCGFFTRKTSENNVILAMCTENSYADTVVIADYTNSKNYFEICEVEVFTIQNIPCRTPDAPMNSYKNLIAKSDGSYYKYTCQIGYQLKGDYIVYCQSNGTFYPPAPTCQAVVCPVPQRPDKGFVNYSKNGELAFNSTANYSCMEGYNLLGSATRKCIGIGHWSGETPICRRNNTGNFTNGPSNRTCEAPVPPLGSIYNASIQRNSKFKVGTKILFQCIEISDETPISSIIECTQNGSWTQTLLSCLDFGNVKSPPEGQSNIITIAAFLIGVVTAVLFLGVASCIVLLRKQYQNQPRSLFHVPLDEGPRPMNEYNDCGIIDEHIYQSAVYEDIRDYLVENQPNKRREQNSEVPLEPVYAQPFGGLTTEIYQSSSHIYSEPVSQSIYSQSSTSTTQTICPSSSESVGKKADIWETASFCNIYGENSLCDDDNDDVFEPQMKENDIYTSDSED